MDTYLVMFGIFAVFLAISAVIGIRDKKRLDIRERRRLRENFGKPGAKEQITKCSWCVLRVKFCFYGI
jgi:hypothetical protein